jgi:hypothetical protein
MTASATECLLSSLPLRIRRIEYEDPILGLIGDDWALSLRCPWVLSGPGWQYTWESTSVEDDAWDLTGHSIESVVFEKTVTEDPRFIISGGISLSIYADDWEPWIMTVPGLDIIGEKV